MEMAGWKGGLELQSEHCSRETHPDSFERRRRRIDR